MTLRFPDLDTFVFALRTGLIPAEIAAAEAMAATSGPEIHIQFDDGLAGRASDGNHAPSLARPANHALARLGVRFDSSSIVGEQLRCWYQAVPLTKLDRAPEIAPQSAVLIEVRDARDWPPLVNELLRLSNDRMSFRTLADGNRYCVLLKVVGMPLYTLLRVVDAGSKSMTAFVEAQPRRWVEYGHVCPLVRLVVPAPEQMLLMRVPRQWDAITDQPFRDIAEALDIAKPVVETAAIVESAAELINLPLRLVPGENSPATLWVVHSSGFEEWYDNLDANSRDRFAIAVSDESIIVRLRPSRLEPPSTLPKGTAFRAHSNWNKLYYPVGARLAPPLRRQKLQELLNMDADKVTWLSTDMDGQVIAHRIDDDAFVPLSSWVEFVLRREQMALDDWAEASEFQFRGIVFPAEETTVERPPAPIAEPAASTHPKPTRSPVSTPPKVKAAPEAPTAVVETSVVRAQLSEVEQQFLRIDGPLDSSERRSLWPAMARLHAAIRQPAEAALAWSQAIWDQPDASLLPEWLAGEGLTWPLTAKRWADLLAEPQSAAAVRVAAVAMIAAGHVGTTAQAEIALAQAYLQAHDHMLPVRIAWLAWSACCRVTGDDLALARARDRILARLLDRGLNAETDMPMFLRFAGRSDAERLRQMRDWIDDIRRRIQHWVFLDLGAGHPTAAYVDLMFAFGLARLGHAHAARDLAHQAAHALGQVAETDAAEAHSFLVEAFTWRIESVIAGQTHGGPLPAEQLDYLVQLHNETELVDRDQTVRRLVPYAIERMRQQSRILEPLERFDPNRHKVHEAEPAVRDALKLPDLRDFGQLPGRINDLLRRAGAPELMIRVLARCVPLVGRMSADVAAPLLERVPAALDAAPATIDDTALETRLNLIERTLFFAAHFDRADLVHACVDRLVRLLKSVQTPMLLTAIDQTIGQMPRSLRKLGLRDQAIQLLDRTAEALLRGQSLDEVRDRDPRRWPVALRAILNVATGWMYFDMPERAAPVLDAVRRLISHGGRGAVAAISAKDYAPLVTDYVTALGLGSPQLAREQITALFAPGTLARLPNTFTTGRYYSRFHLNIAEAVVLTLASDDFTLGPTAKRWLDEDEFLIRRHIHREVRERLGREK